MKVVVYFKNGKHEHFTLRTDDFYNHIENKNDKRARFLIFEEGAVNLDSIESIYPIEPNKALQHKFLEE